MNHMNHMKKVEGAFLLGYGGLREGPASSGPWMESVQSTSKTPLNDGRDEARPSRNRVHY